MIPVIPESHQRLQLTRVRVTAAEVVAGKQLAHCTFVFVCSAGVEEAMGEW